MQLKYLPLILTFGLMPFICLHGQFVDNTEYLNIELRLQGLFKILYSEGQDTIKETINDSIKDEMLNLLKKDRSMLTYPFDSLKNIGKVLSADQNLRLITWHLKYFNGEHAYFGFVQYFNKGTKKYHVFPLSDKSGEINGPETAILTTNNWFGALYYSLIETKHKDNVYYTLLGFDFNDQYSTKKIIEILSFEEDSIAKFGKPIINYDKKIKSRLIFEYSSNVVMSLKYNERMKMIVWDHLSPQRPSLTGKYQFYGPDFSYDALKFEGGYWNYIPDITIK